MELSLRQIIKKLEELADDHQQLNDFRFGDPPEYGADEPIDYPFMGVMLLPGTLGLRTDSLKLRLYLADMVSEGLGNKLEVLSDTRTIAKGIYAQFKDYLSDNGIELTPEAPISDFEEAWDDTVFGFQIDFNITQFFAANACQEPSTFDPADIDSGDVLIYNIETGATITTVNAGGNYGVLQFSGINDEGPPYTNSVVDPG